MADKSACCYARCPPIHPFTALVPERGRAPDSISGLEFGFDFGSRTWRGRTESLLVWECIPCRVKMGVKFISSSTTCSNGSCLEFECLACSFNCTTVSAKTVSVRELLKDQYGRNFSKILLDGSPTLMLQCSRSATSFSVSISANEFASLQHQLCRQRHS